MIQGVLVVQTVAPGSSHEEIATLSVAGAPPAPIVSEPERSTNSLRRFTAACGHWRRTSGGVGTPTRRACSATSTRCAGAELDHNPIALLSEISLDELEKRAGRHVLHSRVHHAFRRMREYSQSTQTWSDPRGGVARALRSPISRPSSASTSRSRSTPAASASWADDHVASVSDPVFRSSLSASSTTRDISASGSICRPGNMKTTSTRTSSATPR